MLDTDRRPLGDGGDRADLCGGELARRSRGVFLQAAARAAASLRWGRLGCCHDHGSLGVGVKAVVYDRYGASDVLRVADVPIPSPAAGQVRAQHSFQDTCPNTNLPVAWLDTSVR